MSPQSSYTVRFQQPSQLARLVLPILCLLFALQVLPLFSYRWVEDESWYSSTAYTLYREGNIRNGSFGDQDIESKADTRPIGMPVTLAATFRGFGVGPSQARIPEFLACLATVAIAFRLGKLLASTEAGLLAALLVSVDNIVFLAARTVRPEAFVTCFGALSVLLYFLSRERDSVLLAALSGVSLGLSFNYHPIGFGVALSLGLLLLHEFRFRVWRSKRAWVLVLASAATLIPFVVWLFHDPIRLEAFRQLYGRGARFTFLALLHGEGIRYADFLGFGNQRFRFLPFPVPLRLHIALLIAASLAVLAWKRRPMFWTLLMLIVPSLLIWPKTANPTVRYFAVTAPYFALAAGIAWLELRKTRWRPVFAAWVAVVVLTQIGGNLLVLRQARSANYASVTRSLRTIVPADARVYGAITFFLALHDRKYYSWHRTPLQFAVDQLGVNYMILNDRVLLHGSGYGNDDWQDIRETASAFVRTSADLVGRVPDPFYGDLEVYRVRR
jgi:4-amino-4-deoxy-L-arabinose transferase-like glycosyltransferase